MKPLRVTWDNSFRIISARLPRVTIFEEIARPEDLENVLAIEAFANERLREVANAIRFVPVADRVIGPGSSYVMAPFAYVRPGRFSPGGVRGVYYAAAFLETAIAETTYHRAAFYAATGERALVAEQRVIEAAIAGDMVTVEDEPPSSPLLDPQSYKASFAFGAEVYGGGADGVLYRSVRHRAEQNHCVAVFRPRCVLGAKSTRYLGYRWDGARISDVFEIQPLTGDYDAEPGARP